LRLCEVERTVHCYKGGMRFVDAVREESGPPRDTLTRISVGHSEDGGLERVRPAAVVRRNYYCTVYALIA
jgi:hypothetical protein